MNKVLKNVTNSGIDLSDTGIEILANSSLTIYPEDYLLFAASNDTMVAIALGNIIVNDGDVDLDPVSGVAFILGSSVRQVVEYSSKHTDNSGKLKFVTSPELHAEDHNSGASDEINVEGLSGVLVDAQHPIPSEVITVMGAKSNANPLNHDRYQQSEISNLPESQLDLVHATHDNANDLSTSQKQALDAANLPSTSNPIATIADQVPGPQGAQGTQGTQGVAGPDGVQGIQGPQGTLGNDGATGEPFSIYKTYTSIISMDADFNNVVFGKFVMIDTGDVNDVDTGKMYFRDTNAFAYIADLSGATGIQGPIGLLGPQGVQGIQGDNGTAGAAGTQGVDGVQGDVGPQGPQGVSGPAGDKRAITIDLVRRGSVSNSWLSLNDYGISSEKAAYTPPFDCKVREIVVTSESSISDASQVGEIEVYYKTRATSGKIETNDAIELSVRSDGVNSMYSDLNSQIWGYDATPENLTLLRSRKYGFRYTRAAGSKSWKDVSIQIILEEI